MNGFSPWSSRHGRRARLANLAGSLLMGCVFIGCVGGDGKGGTGASQSGTPAAVPEFSGIFGYVYGPGDTPLANASIAGSNATTTTDDSGYFELKLSKQGEAVLRIEVAGFLPGIKRVPIGQEKPAAVEVHLLAEATAMPLDATEGGTVTGMRGASLEAPASAFVSASGTVMEGEVQVHLTPIDPSSTDELMAFPGDMSATEMDGDSVMLESFGVLDVTVRADGEKLQIADGKTVTVRIPAPASGKSAPDTIALWSFDEKSGQWVEEGTATLDTASNTYVAEIAHMSYWNCDQPQSSTCVSGTVVDRTGSPVPGAYIVAHGIDYNGASDATANADGTFRMLVRRDSEVSVQAIHPAGGGEIKNIQSQDVEASVPLTASATCQDLGTFTIEAGTLTTGAGEQLACSGVGNPWAGTCAAGFGALAECFQPSGSCTVSFTGGGIQYANGSRIETDLASATSGNVMGTYYGPAGQRCGSYTFVVNSSDPTAPYVGTYDLPDGSTLQMTIDPVDSSQSIECPDGQTLEITAEQQQTYQACLGTDTSSSECEIEGGTGLGECTTNSECATGNECCDFGGGFALCVPPEACPAP